jgi:hypothetical protein
LKVSYTAAAAVALNTLKTGISSGQESEISANTLKVSYTDASTVSSHATLHVAHTADLATKASLSDHQTYTGRQQFGSGAAAVDGRLTIHSNDGGANSLLIMDSRKQADSCLIYMRHAGGNKFSIGLNGNSDLEMYNRATGAAQITLPIGGGVTIADGLSVNGSVGYGIEDQGDVTGNVTLSAPCAVWKLNPTNTPPKTAYLPAPASNTGRVLRVLNVNDAKPIRLKTISDGNFGGAADGSVSLTPQRHITVLCDGTSWYISQDS